MGWLCFEGVVVGEVFELPICVIILEMCKKNLFIVVTHSVFINRSAVL
jgi:hypothetical protein